MKSQLQFSFEEPKVGERPQPSGSLINKLFGGDVGLLAEFNSGLMETPLAAIYPSLDFLEVAAFEPVSRIVRNSGGDFQDSVRNATLYEIFKKVNAANTGSSFSNIYSLINNQRRLNEKLNEKQKEELKELNPFQGTDFQERLEAAASENPAFTEALREALMREPKKYVNETEYFSSIGDKADSGIVLLPYLPVRNSTRPKLASIYSKKIAEKLAGYPTEYSIPDKS